MTLTELLIALGLGTLVAALVVVLYLFGLRSFAGLGNYASLSGQSRLTLDRMSRDIRQATAVIDAQTNLPVKWLTLSNNTVSPPVVTCYTWDSTAGTLTCDQTGQPTRTNLTGCNDFEFAFFQRSPSNAWIFYPTPNPWRCKLLGLSWKCSRAVPGQTVSNTDQLTAQLMLRNKP